MSTTTIKQNIIYGVGEGAEVADTTMLAYALRWANAAYRDIMNRPYELKSLRTKAIFTMTAGQPTYQAPSDFSGLLILKDETNSTILNQVTPEEFHRNLDAKEITDEVFESEFDTAVTLDNTTLVQYSEVVTNEAGTTTYTRDTDYTMNYTTASITVDSTGSMSDATDYEIDYMYYDSDKPDTFCLEYDETNARFVFRVDPAPDAAYIGSILHNAYPSDLSGSVDAVWSRLEYVLERGGMFFGAMEIFAPNDPKTAIFEKKYEQAIEALVKTDMNMIPKHYTIPVIMRKTDYKQGT